MKVLDLLSVIPIAARLRSWTWSASNVVAKGPVRVQSSMIAENVIESQVKVGQNWGDMYSFRKNRLMCMFGYRAVSMGPSI